MLAVYHDLKGDNNWMNPYDNLTVAIEHVHNNSFLVGRKVSRGLIFEKVSERSE